MKSRLGRKKYEGWLWRLLISTTFLTLVSLGGGAWVLAGGYADPPQPTHLILQDQSLNWAGGNQPQNIKAEKITFFFSPIPISLPSNTPFSLEIQATLVTPNNPLAAWGIWLQAAEGKWLLVGINGAQYVTARLCPQNDVKDLYQCSPLIESTQNIKTFWKRFHHICPQGESNRIRLDYHSARWAEGLTIWLNHEWMWDIPYMPEYDLDSLSSHQDILWGIWVWGGISQNTIIQWHKITLRIE